MQYFDRMADIDRSVAKVLEDKHKMAQNRLNSQARASKVYKVGDLVWVLRPKSSPQTSKLDSYWEGPAKIVSRTSRSSYTVQVTDNRVVEVSEAHLKGYN